MPKNITAQKAEQIIANLMSSQALEQYSVFLPYATNTEAPVGVGGIIDVLDQGCSDPLLIAEIAKELSNTPNPNALLLRTRDDAKKIEKFIQSGVWVENKRVWPLLSQDTISKNMVEDSRGYKDFPSERDAYAPFAGYSFLVPKTLEDAKSRGYIDAVLAPFYVLYAMKLIAGPKNTVREKKIWEVLGFESSEGKKFNATANTVTYMRFNVENYGAPGRYGKFVHELSAVEMIAQAFVVSQVGDIMSKKKKDLGCADAEINQCYALVTIADRKVTVRSLANEEDRNTLLIDAGFAKNTKEATKCFQQITDSVKAKGFSALSSAVMQNGDAYTRRTAFIVPYMVSLQLNTTERESYCYYFGSSDFIPSTLCTPPATSAFFSGDINRAGAIVANRLMISAFTASVVESASSGLNPGHMLYRAFLPKIVELRDSFSRFMGPEMMDIVMHEAKPELLHSMNSCGQDPVRIDALMKANAPALYKLALFHIGCLVPHNPTPYISQNHGFFRGNILSVFSRGTIFNSADVWCQGVVDRVTYHLNYLSLASNQQSRNASILSKKICEHELVDRDLPLPTMMGFPMNLKCTIENVLLAVTQYQQCLSGAAWPEEYIDLFRRAAQAPVAPTLALAWRQPTPPPVPPRTYVQTYGLDPSKYSSAAAQASAAQGHVEEQVAEAKPKGFLSGIFGGKSRGQEEPSSSLASSSSSVQGKGVSHSKK